MKTAQGRKSARQKLDEIINGPLANWEEFEQELDAIFKERYEVARANNFYRLQEEDEQEDLSEQDNFSFTDSDVLEGNEHKEHHTAEKVVEAVLEEILDQVHVMRDQELVNQMRHDFTKPVEQIDSSASDKMMKNTNVPARTADFPVRNCESLHEMKKCSLTYDCTINHK